MANNLYGFWVGVVLRAEDIAGWRRERQVDAVR